jgi:hypothetical protein
MLIKGIPTFFISLLVVDSSEFSECSEFSEISELSELSEFSEFSEPSDLLTFPKEFLNHPHLCMCQQARVGPISRSFEGTEESFGYFQFSSEKADGSLIT